MDICVKIENGIVTDSTVGNDVEWISLVIPGTWVLTESPVSVGWTWDEEYGFRPPQPFPECVWESNMWVCPEETFLID